MAGRPLNVLVVDDNEDDARLIARQFRTGGYAVTTQRVDTPEDMGAALREREWDVIIADVTMPRFSAGEALSVYATHQCDSPFLVVSGTIDEETAVSLLKAGAHDFLSKGNLARLLPASEREMRETEGRRARRRAEEALRASEERYALAARGANDGLWDWDLRTDRIYFSSRWASMLGLEDPAGDRPDVWFQRVHEDDLPGLRHSLNEHLAGHSPHFSNEYRILHADGRWRWMLARGMAVFDDDGQPCRIAGSQTDISPHKEAETQLRQAKESLEEAVAAKTRFLAAASHDLRQPVQALLCFASVLEPYIGEPVGKGTYGDLMDSLDSLVGLLDALLDVSKLDAGIIKADLQSFTVGDLLSRVATEMTPVAEGKGLELRMAGSSARVRSDPLLLGRILRNLVDNAIRYTDQGRILIGCRRREGAIMIQVRDTGIGVSEDAKTHIFEEFYQVANPERDRRKGLGLGLAIVSRLTRLLDHPLSVDSVPGRGSCFSVTIPLTHDNGTRQPAKPTELPFDPAEQTVLVIDDEKMVANALAALLSAWGFRVMAAASVEEALAAIGHAPAAIVADYRLREGRTGVEAVSEVQTYFRRHIPSIVVTGDIAADRLRDIVQSGAQLLHKPVAPKELRAALQTALASPSA
jgi:two-component system, sensor histidine kinase